MFEDDEVVTPSRQQQGKEQRKLVRKTSPQKGGSAGTYGSQSRDEVYSNIRDQDTGVVNP